MTELDPRAVRIALAVIDHHPLGSRTEDDDVRLFIEEYAAQTAIHPFQGGGGCMSRCRCGRTFSDPIHGEQSENIKRIREVLYGDHDPVPGGTTAIRDGKYVREEKA